MEKEYIGDSVYVEYDEYGSLILTTENGFPDDPRNRIILEDSVCDALLSYIERFKSYNQSIQRTSSAGR